MRTRITFGLTVFTLTAAVIAVAGAAQQRPAPRPADFVLRGGKIVTLDAAKPEVQALAARVAARRAEREPARARARARA